MGLSLFSAALPEFGPVRNRAAVLKLQLVRVDVFVQQPRIIAELNLLGRFWVHQFYQYVSCLLSTSFQAAISKSGGLKRCSCSSVAV